MWFQNRRARHRKQERTGSVSFRSRYRQKRLKKLQERSTMTQIYNSVGGNYGLPSSQNHPAAVSGQTMSQVSPSIPVSPQTSDAASTANTSMASSINLTYNLPSYSSSSLDMPTLQSNPMSAGNYFPITTTAAQFALQYPSIGSFYNNIPPTSEKQ